MISVKKKKAKHQEGTARGAAYKNAGAWKIFGSRVDYIPRAFLSLMINCANSFSEGRATLYLDTKTLLSILPIAYLTVASSLSVHNNIPIGKLSPSCISFSR